jgi:hypothetical protein
MPTRKPQSARQRSSRGAGWILTGCFPVYILLSFAGRYWFGIGDAPTVECMTCALVSISGLAELAGRDPTSRISSLLAYWARNRGQ